MKKQVDIISATECKTLNPIDKPNINEFKDDLFCESGDCKAYRDWLKEYEQAESERKVYKIVNFKEIFQYGFDTTEGVYVEYDSIHEAEVNEETNEAIIL